MRNYIDHRNIPLIGLLGLFFDLLQSFWAGAACQVLSNNESSISISSGYFLSGESVRNYIGTISNSGTINLSNNLQMESGSSIVINEGAVLIVGGTVTNNAGTSGLVVKSSASGDGSYIGPSTDATVERYLEKDTWHLVSSPVSGALSAVYYGLYMKNYSESDDSFGPLITPTDVPLTTGRGSAIWTTINKSVVFKGAINPGPVNPSTPRSTNGFTLIGNPYAAVIDWNASGWTKEGIAASTWVWNGSQYDVWNGSVGTGSASRYIALGQGFFVQAENTTAGLKIPESARVVLHISSLFRSAIAEPPLIRLKVIGNDYSDEAVIMQADDALTSIDYRFDALKMAGSASAPQLSIKKDGRNFSIASLSAVDSMTIIPVSVKTGSSGSFTLSIANSFNTTGLNTFLSDKMTGNVTRTDLQPDYNFNASPSDNPDRFEILFRKQSMITSVPHFEESGGEIKIWNHGKLLHVDIPSDEAPERVDIYTLNGSKVRTYEGINIRNIDTGLNSAMYIVRVITSRQSKTQKLIIF